MDFQGKKVLIVGMARSGMAAARLLCGKGAEVSLFDAKSAEALGEKLAELSDLPLTLILGAEPAEEVLASFEYLILSPGVAPDQPMVEKAASHGAAVWGEVELAWLFAKAPVIGITGTNGKTTTVSLCTELVKACFPGTVAAGNIGTAYSEVTEQVEAPDWVVDELSSFQLEMTETFRPKISAMLNITPDHLNRHHTMENYVGAKMKVFANQGRGDFAVLNADDPYCVKMGGELAAKENGPEVIWFSRRIRPGKGVWTEDGRFYSNLKGETEELGQIAKMPIFGSHNEENALAAIACALCAGVPAEAIAEPLYAFRGVEHRIEYTATVDGVRYFNDSKATNPDSAVKGLLAMPAPTVLIGGGMDKKIPFDDWCELFPGRVRRLILLGETREIIRECALRHGYPEENIETVATLEEAVEACRLAAQPGDCVLLSPACASWDMFESYEVRGRLFKDLVRAFQ